MKAIKLFVYGWKEGILLFVQNFKQPLSNTWMIFINQKPQGHSKSGTVNAKTRTLGSERIKNLSSLILIFYRVFEKMSQYFFFTSTVIWKLQKLFLYGWKEGILLFVQNFKQPLSNTWMIYINQKPQGHSKSRTVNAKTKI